MSTKTWETKLDEFVNQHIKNKEKLFETQLEAHNIAVAATAGYNQCRADMLAEWIPAVKQAVKDITELEDEIDQHNQQFSKCCGGNDDKIKQHTQDCDLFVPRAEIDRLESENKSLKQGHVKALKKAKQNIIERGACKPDDFKVIDAALYELEAVSKVETLQTKLAAALAENAKLKEWNSDLDALEARLSNAIPIDDVKGLVEALRKAVLWGECVRTKEPPTEVNYRYIDEARETLKAFREKHGVQNGL